MTPLIDVMLVLLVIFIITAPLMTSSLKLDLPKTDSATPTSAPAFIALAIDADGRLFFGDEPLNRDALALRVAAAARANPQLEVQLRADQKVESAHRALGLVPTTYQRVLAERAKDPA